MQQRKAWGLLVALSSALAGCVGQGGPGGGLSASDDPSTSRASGSGGEATGTIVGTVLDDEGLTIEGVQILLLPGDLVVSSSADGAYGFQGLSPQTYTLIASRIGFLNNEAILRVDPGLVVTHDFLLEPVPVLDLPHSRVFGPFTGYFQCRWSIEVYPAAHATDTCGTVPGVGPTPVNSAWTEDARPGDFPLEADDWRSIVIESQWTRSSQASREDLVQFLSYSDRECNHWFEQSGPQDSPIQFTYEKGVPGGRRNIPEAPVECADQPASPATGMILRTWMQIPDAQWFDPVQYQMEVRYEMMATVFYGVNPAEDYSAFADG